MERKLTAKYTGHGQDVKGMRSGRLVAIEPTAERRRGSVLWRCRCDCGNEILAEGYRIASGKVKSCGCSRREMKTKDLAGKRFGRLTAIRRLDKKRGSCYLWLCRCDCGNEIEVTVNSLMTGNTKSCGCMRQDTVRSMMEKYGTITDHVTLVDNTFVERIQRKELQKNNTSGCTGVQRRGNHWIAVITFQKQVHYLGIFREKSEAIRARKQAEERFFGEYLEEYERNKTGGQTG
ncbi:MAG: hypothetical protein J6N77_05635 [Lachnospiraceae bacterium]|nr:hypothetical protein [Lachnospiraceae bacterium]